MKVAKTLTTIIQNLRNAPSELLALSNEIWNPETCTRGCFPASNRCFSIKSAASYQDSEESGLLSIPVSRMAIRTRTCSRDCACPCHTQTLFKIPQALREIAGRLFLGYSGRPVLQQRCVSSCFHEESKPTTLTYSFPSWFAKQVLSLTMFNTVLNIPTFNIKIRRVVLEVSPLFAFSRNSLRRSSETI